MIGRCSSSRESWPSPLETPATDATLLPRPSTCATRMSGKAAPNDVGLTLPVPVSQSLDLSKRRRGGRRRRLKALCGKRPPREPQSCKVGLLCRNPLPFGRIPVGFGALRGTDPTLRTEHSLCASDSRNCWRQSASRRRNSSSLSTVGRPPRRASLSTRTLSFVGGGPAVILQKASARVPPKLRIRAPTPTALPPSSSPPKTPGPYETSLTLDPSAILPKPRSPTPRSQRSSTARPRRRRRLTKTQSTHWHSRLAAHPPPLAPPPQRNPVQRLKSTPIPHFQDTMVPVSSALSFAPHALRRLQTAALALSKIRRRARRNGRDDDHRCTSLQSASFALQSTIHEAQFWVQMTNDRIESLLRSLLACKNELLRSIRENVAATRRRSATSHSSTRPVPAGVVASSSAGKRQSQRYLSLSARKPLHCSRLPLSSSVVASGTTSAASVSLFSSLSSLLENGNGTVAGPRDSCGDSAPAVPSVNGDDALGGLLTATSVVPVHPARRRSSVAIPRPAFALRRKKRRRRRRKRKKAVDVSGAPGIAIVRPRPLLRARRRRHSGTSEKRGSRNGKDDGAVSVTFDVDKAPPQALAWKSISLDLIRQSIKKMVSLTQLLLQSKENGTVGDMSRISRLLFSLFSEMEMIQSFLVKFSEEIPLSNRKSDGLESLRSSSNVIPTQRPSATPALSIGNKNGEGRTLLRTNTDFGKRTSSSPSILINGHPRSPLSPTPTPTSPPSLLFPSSPLYTSSLPPHHSVPLLPLSPSERSFLLRADAIELAVKPIETRLTSPVRVRLGGRRASIGSSHQRRTKQTRQNDVVLSRRQNEEEMSVSLSPPERKHSKERVAEAEKAKASETLPTPLIEESASRRPVPPPLHLRARRSVAKKHRQQSSLRRVSSTPPPPPRPSQKKIHRRLSTSAPSRRSSSVAVERVATAPARRRRRRRRSGGPTDLALAEMEPIRGWATHTPADDDNAFLPMALDPSLFSLDPRLSAGRQ